MYSKGKAFIPLIVGIMSVVSQTISAQTLRQDTLAQVIVSEKSTHDPIRLSVSSAAPVQGVSGQVMSQLGITDVAGALKLMSGIQVKDYGGMGGMKSISIRHLGAQHTAVLYDGVPVSNCQAGQIDVSRFATDQHSSVTLTIGSPQSLLAPASVQPYSGQIDIRNTHSGNSVSVSYSNWNTWNGNVTYNRGQFQGKLNYRHTDGNYPFTLTNGNEQTREVRNNGRYDAVTSQLEHRKEWQGGSNVRSQLYYHYSNQGLPGGIILYNMVSHQQMRDHNLLLQSRGEWLLTDRFTLVTIAKYNLSTTWYDDGNLASNNSPDGYGKVNNYRQQEGFLSAAMQFRVKRLSLAVVQDLALNTLWSDIRENPNPVRLSSHTAIRARLAMPVEVRASLVFVHTNDWCSDAPDHNFALPDVSLSLPLWRQLRLRASWRKAIRLPSFNDLYYYQLGNHSLRPEQSQQWNLGLTYQYDDDDNDNDDDDDDGKFSLSASADVYHYDVTDKIVAFPTTFAWKMVNLGRESFNGLNVSLSAAYRFRKDVQLSVSGSYDYQDIRIPYSPQHTAAVGALAHTPWVDVGYRLQVSGTRYSKLDREWRYRLDAFADHSLTFSRSFRVSGDNAYRTRNLRISFSIINFTNQQYEIIQYYPMPGCHCRLGVSYDF